MCKMIIEFKITLYFNKIKKKKNPSLIRKFFKKNLKMFIFNQRNLMKKTKC